jgi:tetratricopeptide (TPR) repeat protein
MSAFLVAFIVLLQQPAEAAALFQRAVELQRGGQFAEAEAQYRALLAVRPDYAEAHANLGAVLMRLDRYEEAIASYESALRLAPSLTPVLLNLGIAHYRTSHFDQAVESLGRFLDAAPGHLQATQLLGLSYLELGRDAEAIERLERALATAPDDTAVLYGLGMAYLRTRSSKLDPIIERLGGGAAAHLLKGQSALATYQFERAAAELEEAARMNPGLPRLDYSLGVSYVKLARYQDARAALMREVARAPRDFSTLYYLAFTLEALGDLSGARGRLEDALAIEADSAEANTLLGKVLVKLGNNAEAAKAFEIAVRKDPEDGAKHFQLARVYQQLGRKEDAAREFAESERLKEKQLEQDRARMTKKP